MSAPKIPFPKQLRNEQAVTIYAGFLCGLIVCVASARWWHAWCNRTSRPSSVGGVRSFSRRARILITSTLERRTPWPWFGRPSIGLVLLVAVYLTVNVILCHTLLSSHAINHFASRYGWMGAANMSLCVFFGMKNTPLSLISRASHATINIFHRIVGYVAVFLIVLHAIVYLFHFGGQGKWEQFIRPSDLAGIGAGLAMLTLLVFGLYRHRNYELFYATHVVGFLVAIGLAYLHRPNWAKKLPIVMIFMGVIWGADRIVRGARVLRNLLNNAATIYPLPGGGTRVLIKKLSAEDAPGSHVYLWIPGLRLFQMHPFTVVSSGRSGLELVVKSHDGFTRALGDLAIDQPGGAAWVSVDGPYASLPDVEAYDKLVLIAGGSGAAFTFGLMNRMLRHPERLASQTIEFIWAVRHTEQLEWFAKHLKRLIRPGSGVKVTVYVTNAQPGEDIFVLPDVPKYEGDEEDREEEPLLGGCPSRHTEHTAGITLEYNKLDIETVVGDAVISSDNHQRILISTCGPKTLMDAVRDSVDMHCRKTNNSIDVHCEDFGS
ncbi:ferric reductase NAD binding domain-containing protein [Plectosphaerella plurivora]|uniref:Ferric reductase NAD binding domain-containing protein n=1 Tax=Plectosphaerella plurivora TaxID=936078 RepID=A0A9P8VET9_9PEZI|nr:ferric reductase NAD binding domain-containing protein [Plectosphaerella plurivora]